LTCGSSPQLIETSRRESGRDVSPRPVFPIERCANRLPPLCERKVDIPLLVAHFLDKFSDPLQPVREISDDALRRLMAYDWPGNVRELENAIECALALSSHSVLTADDLPSVPYRASTLNAPFSNALVPLEELERRAIANTLRETEEISSPLQAS